MKRLILCLSFLLPGWSAQAVQSAARCVAPGALEVNRVLVQPVAGGFGYTVILRNSGRAPRRFAAQLSLLGLSPTAAAGREQELPAGATMQLTLGFHQRRAGENDVRAALQVRCLDAAARPHRR